MTQVICVLAEAVVVSTYIVLLSMLIRPADKSRPGLAEVKKAMRIAGRKLFVIGGAGFIGSHMVERLLDEDAACVTVFDNYSSGRRWHLESRRDDIRLHLTEGDASYLDSLMESMPGHEIVFHFASNSDIARAATHPEIDFYQGTLLTHQVLEAVRRCGIDKLLYASGSGVYGERGEEKLDEYAGPFVPISTYGASKLAGEALIASYCAMFGMAACAFRFGNVVGARQTHGVGFDFLRRLRLDASRLRVLGDGSQSKPYVHVSDAVSAMLLAHERSHSGFQVFNVATEDALRVDEIAAMALDCAGSDKATVLEYSGGDRGWKGDVPVVRLKIDRARALGWRPEHSSREAMLRAMKELLSDDRSFWN
jgi:UDP-glucose 4-epimerase